MRRLVGLALGMLVVGGAPASANEVGMNAHVPTEDALDALADLGVHWVRVDANWFVMEPREGAYDWREMDRVVQGAGARGLKVFMTLAYAPQWATEPNGDEIATNDIPRAGTYGRFVEAAVSRYRPMGVTHYGIWNEPNLRQFFEGTVDEYADRIVRPGSDAVRRACADCFALGPDLAGIGGWQAFLGDVLERVGDRFDILAHHTYRAPQSVGARWICDDFDHAMDIGDDAICFYSPGLRQVLDGAAWQGEVWLTETGHRADPWDDPGAQADQVATVEHVIDRQLATPWWTNTFFYELIDCRPAQPDCPIDGYGFLRRTAPTDDTWRDNFVVKPVFEALQRLIDDEPALGRVAPIEPPPPPMAPRIEAPRRSEGAPDGELDEWDDSGCVVLDDYEVLGAPRAGPADVSARACAAWSEDALWLSVDVEDAVHDNEQPADLIWQGDSVQLAIDVDADAAGAGYDADDLEIGLALAGGETRLFAFHGALGAADGAVRRDGARTRYELKVPLPALAPERVVRASFLVNDADGNGRDGWLEWTPGIGREKDPSAFGEVVLADRESMPPPPPGPPAEDGGRPPPPLPEPPDVGGGGTGDIDGGAEAATDAGGGRDAATGAPAEDTDATGLGRAPSGDAGARTDGGGDGDGDGGGDGGCDVADPSPGGSLLWWLLLAGVGVRRRSRARRPPGWRPSSPWPSRSAAAPRARATATVWMAARADRARHRRSRPAGSRHHSTPRADRAPAAVEGPSSRCRSTRSRRRSTGTYGTRSRRRRTPSRTTRTPRSSTARRSPAAVGRSARPWRAAAAWSSKMARAARSPAPPPGSSVSPASRTSRARAGRTSADHSSGAARPATTRTTASAAPKVSSSRRRRAPGRG